MNWKQLFCRHDYIPTHRGFIGYGKRTENAGISIDVFTTHRHVTTYECIKCDKKVKRKSEVNSYFDRPQPYDSDFTKRLLKDN